MKFEQFSKASDLLQKVGYFLEKEEVQHNLPLGVLRQLEREEKEGKASSPFLAAGLLKGRPEALLIQTPPRRMIVCGSPQAMPEAASWLEEIDYPITGIVGCEKVAKAFSTAWEARTNETAELVKQQIIYELHEVKDWKQPPGKLTYASEDDVALVMDWTESFAMGSLRKEDIDNLEDTVLDEIRHNQVFLWRDRDYTPVSMAKRARELTNGIVVNYVYTPEEYERRGFATACVGALAERMLQEGFQFCSLNTNEENNASNAIYKKLGFVPVGKSLEYEFKKK
ncbi:GNAT family N-acetyltransferase [Alkalicoccus daliensis]|uniref:N-acetyltransferase domain-containing protein n=1 Tax=Alkalicoccus daliensis TaxID=745820 RepID=A0A1H0IC09_9BACI|nr:GNAT family N-acetyltransferase [Alkalicoccus daliensis]SDO28790.1 hypothetical protein SAMN04488053_11080 [Alkalicoccus daliensis]